MVNVFGTTRFNTNQRMMAVNAAGTTAFRITLSELSVGSLTPTGTGTRPAITTGARGIVNSADAIGGSWASTAFGEPRFTNDIDILADFTPETLDRFLNGLPRTLYADRDDAQLALRLGKPFNVIHVPMAWKFDFFPASAFLLGFEELDRAVFLAGTGLSEASTPFVSPEDILLAKLHWFTAGGEVSEMQWRDVLGIIRACGSTLDGGYLERSAARLGLLVLLKKALGAA